MKKIFVCRSFHFLSGVLCCALLLLGAGLAAKGNKVPFIKPDGTRQETGASRSDETQRSMWERADAKKTPPADPKQGKAADGKAASPDGELRLTATFPKPVYEPGEYRPNRPSHWTGRAGKTELTLDRAERGRDEVLTVSVKSSIPDWKRFWTPLHTAAALGDRDGIKKTLAEKSVGVDASREFLTPLHVAAAAGQEDAARLLLQGGANITVKTPEGKSAADLATLSRQPQLARLLTVFTVARNLTDDGKTVTVRLDRGGTVDLTGELRRIAAGYRDEHRHDASVFGNYEGKLPRRERYYYTEFVHRTTPRSVGPRRLVIGMKGDVWYTPDHYETFVRVGK
ncbi:MAG: ankyrin repeat domain-containing protein [Thermoguttaceae bacterium]|nr:ankyrin repeat domain-containing protein [Thermoguttaceae bacterium]